MSVSFGRGEGDRAKKVMTELFEQGLDAEQKESVHPSTLKAFAREQIEGANQVFDQKARDLFSIYEGKRTKIVK